MCPGFLVLNIKNAAITAVLKSMVKCQERHPSNSISTFLAPALSNRKDTAKHDASQAPFEPTASTMALVCLYPQALDNFLILL